MSLKTPARKKKDRHPLWSIDTLKEDLRAQAITLRAICQKWAPSANRWQGLYNEVRIWRQTDPELEELIRLNTLATDSKKRKAIGGGRPKADVAPENHSWRTDFCEALLVHKSRTKAALVTPYTPETIYKMLNERYTEYDREFAEMVHLAEMRLVAWAEETIWAALDEATLPKDKAWIAKEILKVRDRQRWGDKLDINMTGHVTHTAQVNKEALLLEASKEISGFLAAPKEVKALPQGDVVDAEVVND